MAHQTIDPVAVTIPTACAASGLGRTKLYELIGAGRVESVRVGTRRLVIFESLKSFLTEAGRAAL